MKSPAAIIVAGGGLTLGPYIFIKAFDINIHGLGVLLALISLAGVPTIIWGIVEGFLQAPIGEGFHRWGINGVQYKGVFKFRIMNKNEAEYIEGLKRLIVEWEIGSPGALYMNAISSWESGEPIEMDKVNEIRQNIEAAKRKMKWNVISS